MAYHVLTGEIASGRLYVVIGAQSVTYNTITYATGQTFRGVRGIVTFTFSGSGNQEVNEVHELTGGAIEYIGTAVDNPGSMDVTLLKGIAVEFALNNGEKIVNEVTNIKGFAVELIDYPFYSFVITETRL